MAHCPQAQATTLHLEQARESALVASDSDPAEEEKQDEADLLRLLNGAGISNPHLSTPMSDAVYSV